MSCVSEGELLSFFEGRLPGAARAKVLAHLDGCEICHAVLAGLAEEGRAEHERLGPYSLIKRLGRGGMGEVFLAERDGVECVVKRLLPELSSNREALKRFQQEAAVLARLQHPNIGRLLDFGDQYLALERIDGVDFRTLLKRFKAEGAIAPAGLAVELVRQAAAGLAAAHAAKDARGKSLQLIHRDVSPGNLMVDRHGLVKVIDFGMAQAAINEATATGVVMGKLPYFSPEQARGDRLDARSDIFSLGLVLQEFLTGRRAYASPPRQLARDVAAGRTTEPPPEVWVIPALWELVKACVAPKPDDRFPTMAAVERALGQAQQKLSLSLPAEAVAALVA